MLPVIPSRCPIIDVAGGAQARGFHRRVLRPASRAGAFMQRAMAGLRALLGIRTVYDVHPSGIPLLTAVSLGRLCLCIYHRCDAFVSPHDHPYDYWTFPLTTYVENVMCLLPDIDIETARLGTKRQKVTAFLPHRIYELRIEWEPLPAGVAPRMAI